MRKTVIVIGVLVSFLWMGIFPVSAHDKAQPHFLRIDGSYLAHSPISSTSLPDFILPQEIATTPLEVNKQHIFQVEKTSTPLANTLTSDTSFFIDFGDGQKENGVKRQHAYTRAGTYIVSISVQPLSSKNETIIMRAWINVVPSKTYQLPKAVITVNGAPAIAKERDATFSRPIQFDALESTPKSHIVNYFWDLGDGQTSDKATLAHTYASYNTAANVILRIKDDKGFIADSTIRIVDQKNSTPKPQSNTIMMHWKTITLVLIGSIGVLLGSLFIFMRKAKNAALIP